MILVRREERDRLMKPVVSLYKLGRLPYLKVLNFQQNLFNDLRLSVRSHDSNRTVKIRSKNPNQQDDGNNIEVLHNAQENSHETKNSLILVEHEPVYTIGIRTKQYNDSYVSKLKERLSERKLDAQIIKTNRGGLITFHGPGQLVAYPIIYLGNFSKIIPNKSVRAYVSTLETTIINTLAQVGLSGAHTVKEYPGVWLNNGDRKIAFIGITCQSYVTMHGISINCDCDLSWFDHIVSCGIEDKLITSVRQELPCKGPSYELVSRAFCSSFSQYFDCELIETQEEKTKILI